MMEGCLEDFVNQIRDCEEFIHQCETDRSEIHNICLFYDPKKNRFYDEYSNPIWNPEALVPSYMIDIFKAQRSYFYGTMHGGNTIVELFWPDDEEVMDPQNRFGQPPWDIYIYDRRFTHD